MLALPYLSYVHGPKCKAYKLDKPKALAYWSLKYDGFCILVHKDETGRVAIITKKGEDYTERLRWHPIYGTAVATLPPGCVVAGELHNMTTSRSIQTAINTEDPKLEFTAFGVPTMAYGASMLAAAAFCEARGIAFVEYGLFSGNVLALPYGIGETARLPKGVEGYVFRDGQYRNLYKWKPIDTIDLIVANIHEGKDNYAGTCGALSLITCENHLICRVSSGLTLMERQEYWSNPASIIGEVVEIAYDSVAVNSLRFPRLVRVRMDKARAECTIDQSEELQEAFANKGQG